MVKVCSITIRSNRSLYQFYATCFSNVNRDRNSNYFSRIPYTKQQQQKKNAFKILCYITK